jgi:hypothetical protein
VPPLGDSLAQIHAPRPPIRFCLFSFPRTIDLHVVPPRRDLLAVLIRSRRTFSD